MPGFVGEKALQRLQVFLGSLWRNQKSVMSWVAILLVPWCLLVLGVSVWPLLNHVLTAEVPPAISHPLRFQILHYLFQLTVPWIPQAPDHRHPAIFQDCLKTSICFLKSLKTYGVDPSRVVVCGESIGGWTVASVLQALMRIPDLPQIRAQILIYPLLQAVSFQLPSRLQNQNVLFLSRDFMVSTASKYLTVDISWKDDVLTGAHVPPDTWMEDKKRLSSDNIPERFRNKFQSLEFPSPFNKAAYLESKHLLGVEISPLGADDETTARLPEALLVSLHWDILRDDILLYKKRLEDQGVPVTWHHVEDGFHGCLVLFDSKFFSFPCCWNIINAVISYTKGI